MLCFFCASIVTFLGFAKLGFLINYISGSVLRGFLNAQGFALPVSQLPALFGVKGGSGGIINKIYTVFEQVFAGEANWYDFSVGASGIAFLVALKLFGAYAGKISPKLEGSKLVWFIDNSKNTILIIIMMIAAVCTETTDQVENYLGGCKTGHRDPNDPTGQNCTTLTLTKIQNVQPPEFTYPSFHFNYEFCNEKLEATFEEESEEPGEWVYASELRYPEDWKLEDQNLTITCTDDQKPDVWFVSFNDIWIELGAAIFVQTIISFLEHISISKTLARMPPASPLEQSQEFVAWGLTNLSNSFVFGGFLITASMSRSVVQEG